MYYSIADWDSSGWDAPTVCFFRSPALPFIKEPPLPPFFLFFRLPPWRRIGVFLSGGCPGQLELSPPTAPLQSLALRCQRIHTASPRPAADMSSASSYCGPRSRVTSIQNSPSSPTSGSELHHRSYSPQPQPMVAAPSLKDAVYADAPARSAPHIHSPSSSKPLNDEPTLLGLPLKYVSCVTSLPGISN